MPRKIEIPKEVLTNGVSFKCPDYPYLKIKRAHNQPYIAFVDKVFYATDPEDIKILNEHPWVCVDSRLETFPCPICQDVDHVYPSSAELRAHLLCSHG